LESARDGDLLGIMHEGGAGDVSGVFVGCEDEDGGDFDDGVGGDGGGGEDAAA